MPKISSATATTALACLLALGASGAARAAAKVGWAWANQPNASGPYTPLSAYSYNASGGAVTITPTGTGLYTVDFAGLNSSYPDTVQITAYDTNGYCRSNGWNGNVQGEAYVACFDAAGAPANSDFTILYEARGGDFGNANAGLAYMYADKPTAPSYSPDRSFNSTGGANSIARNSVGSWTVTIPGLTKVGGEVQVTEQELQGGARCVTAGWGSSGSGTSVNVLCFDATGAPADEAYALMYALHEPFGLVSAKKTPGAWAWANLDTTASYTPSPVYQYNGLKTGYLTATRGGTGTYTLTVPTGETYSHSTVLVTAYGRDVELLQRAELERGDQRRQRELLRPGRRPGRYAVRRHAADGEVSRSTGRRARPVHPRGSTVARVGPRLAPARNWRARGLSPRPLACGQVAQSGDELGPAGRARLAVDRLQVESDRSGRDVSAGGIGGRVFALGQGGGQPRFRRGQPEPGGEPVAGDQWRGAAGLERDDDRRALQFPGQGRCPGPGHPRRQDRDDRAIASLDGEHRAAGPFRLGHAGESGASRPPASGAADRRSDRLPPPPRVRAPGHWRAPPRSSR